MASEKYTAQLMIDALTDTRGMITLAAKRLGCAPNTVRRYVENYATVAEAKKEAHENLGDQVELTLVSMALGERDKLGKFTREPNIASLIFLAKTQFKDRGYVERQEYTGKDGGAIPIEHSWRAVVEAAKGEGDDGSDNA